MFRLNPAKTVTTVGLKLLCLLILAFLTANASILLESSAIAEPQAAQETIPVSIEKNADDRERNQQIRDSIGKALPYIQKRGDWWIKRNKCMSCHRTSFTAWSHVAAKDAGMKVDQKDVDRWMKFNLKNLMEPFPKKDQKFDGEKTINRNLSGAAQMLFVTSKLAEKRFQDQEMEILRYLSKGQESDGSWKPRGQLPGQKRPLAETTQVITHWNSLGLLQLKKNRPELTNRIDPLIKNAKRFSRQYEKGVSSEWIAVRLLFDARIGHVASAKKMLKILRMKQNSDGGWGWIAGKKSDWLATSQIIYILTEVRKLHPEWVTEEEIQRPVSLLLKKQKRKGTWENRGTKTEMNGRIEPTATYWATTWAVIAFSNVLENSQSNE